MRIRYYGHFQQQTGYGNAAVKMAAALLGAGHRIEPRAIGKRETWHLPGADGGTNPDAVIVHTLPGDCARVLELDGLRRGAGPKLVAYTTWEARSAPPEVVAPLFASFDQVWVPSLANATAFGKQTYISTSDWFSSWRVFSDAQTRLRVIPHCFDTRPAARERPIRWRFRFYWIGAWTSRKNPAGLIRAFALAFSHDNPVELVMHSPGCSMDAFVAALAQTGVPQPDLPMITLSNQHLPSLERLHAESDCFVTASRGEAWNLPAFDAMLAGRHVISQMGLGSDDFLTDTSAALVGGFEAPAQVDVSWTAGDDNTVSLKTIGAQGLSSRSLWLEPDLCALADAMQSAFKDRERTIAVHYDPAERFGYAAVARLATKALEEA